MLREKLIKIGAKVVRHCHSLIDRTPSSGVRLSAAILFPDVSSLSR